MSDVERSARPSLVFVPGVAWRTGGAAGASGAAATGRADARPDEDVGGEHGAAAPAAVGDATVQAFVALLLEAPDEHVDAFLRRLTDGEGIGAERVYLDLLAPAARELGARWADDRCDFVAVTVGCARMQRLLHALARGASAEPAGGHAVVVQALLTTVPGEQHTFGLSMLGECFLRDGWHVCVGPPRSEAELLTLIRDRWFDMVGFSVACDARLGRLTREIRRVRRFARNRGVVVLVGGPIFDERPGLVARVGADGTASDAATAPRVARRLLSERGGPWPEHLPS